MIGVKSTALAWGDNTKRIATYLNMGMVGLLAGAGYSSGIGLLYYPGIAANFLYMRDLIQKVDLNDRASCNKFFVRNSLFGFFVLTSIILGKVYV